MFKIDVRADIRNAQRFLANLKQGAVKRAAARAINDCLVTVRADGARLIKQKHPAMRIGDIKNNIATHKATAANLVGRVETKGRPLSLLLFQARETRKGVTARIGAGQRQVATYHGRKGFTVGRYGGEVFVRQNAKGRKLRRFRGPSMPGVFRAQSKRFKDIAERKWAAAFASRMKYEIERAKVQ